MDILILGAGVQGSYYAVQCLRSGHAVEILARGKKLSQINKDGITLHNPIRNLNYSNKIKAIESPADKPYDLVIVCVQAIQVSTVLPILANMKMTKSFLFLGNNVSGFSEARELLGEDRVFAGFGNMGGMIDENRIIFVEGPDLGASNSLIYGFASGGMKPQKDIIENVFHNSGIRTIYTKYINDFLYTHAATILPLAAAFYHCDGSLEKLVEDHELLIEIFQTLDQAIKILKSNRIRIIPFRYRIINFLPRNLLIKKYSKFLSSKAARIGLGGHAAVARNEMRELAHWLLNMAKSGGKNYPLLQRYLTEI